MFFGCYQKFYTSQEQHMRMQGDGESQMKISVITPSFNSGAYIERAIKSVLMQGYENFEHIIIDGLSTDNTIEILQQYPHLQWISEADSGQSNAMNKGFAIATGDIIVYLNADDYFLSGAFQAVIPLFQRGEVFVVGDIYQIGLDGNKIRRRPKTEHINILKHWEDWGAEDDCLFSAFPNNPVQYFYLREVQQRFPFNENNHFTMDLEFLMNASSQYNFYKIDTILGVYTLYEDAKSIVASNDIINYWTFENFSYIDHFIKDWDSSSKISFKNEQQKGYIYRALNQYRGQINKELKHKDNQLHIKQKLIEEKDTVIKEHNKKFGDLYRMVAANNPLNIIRAIRFIKKIGRSEYE